MSPDRRTALAALSIAVALLAAGVLFRVLGTVFVAVSVGYVLVPLGRDLEGRGLPPWPAALLVSLGAFVGAVLLFVPFGIVLYVRRRPILEYVRSLPASVDVEVGGLVLAVALDDLRAAVVPSLTGLAVSLTRSAAVLSVKLTLFAFVVFALAYHRRNLRRIALAPAPAAYHDALEALHGRARTTLVRLYVANVAAAAVTYLLALGLFLVLDYRLPFALALLAALLRLLPAVTPALLIAVLAVAHLAAGQPVMAAVVGIAGSAVIVVPDRLLRPWLSGFADPVPTTLYVVGLLGGVLTVGPVGVFAGPLAVALLVEAASLLATEEVPSGA